MLLQNRKKRPASGEAKELREQNGITLIKTYRMFSEGRLSQNLGNSNSVQTVQVQSRNNQQTKYMIRSKQLDELKALNRNLRSLGIGSKPDLENHVMMALVSGEVPKMKPVNSVSAAARKAIVSDRYNRHLSFADVFASTNGYAGELKQWEAHEKNRLLALSKYDKQADKIMLKALDADADAAEISEHLHEAAEKAGLKALKAPVFE